MQRWSSTTQGQREGCLHRRLGTEVTAAAVVATLGMAMAETTTTEREMAARNGESSIRRFTTAPGLMTLTPACIRRFQRRAQSMRSINRSRTHSHSPQYLAVPSIAFFSQCPQYHISGSRHYAGQKLRLIPDISSASFAGHFRLVLAHDSSSFFSSSEARLSSVPD